MTLQVNIPFLPRQKDSFDTSRVKIKVYWIIFNFKLSYDNSYKKDEFGSSLGRESMIIMALFSHQ